MLDISVGMDKEIDLNSNFDLITGKAMEIENWINNLTLLNNRTIQMNQDRAMEQEHEMIKHRRSLMELEKVEKQIININQIASSSKLTSVQKRHRQAKRRAHHDEATQHKELRHEGGQQANFIPARLL